ncbi:MAG: class IV adenylate cyclase [Nanoarchaeota archaeon]|nr:class IV adenylate cyclase [Nanoarchaeota archaeon]
MKIEVEIKIKISSPQQFRKKASGLGKFIGIEKKIDDYYTLEELSHYPKKSLRIRKRKGQYEVNFKQKLSYINGAHAKKEYEFIIPDIKDFLDLIKEFGFKKWLHKEKISEVYEIKKNFHIEINHVKNLGWYLEIEYLATPSEIKEGRKEIDKIINKLGITNEPIIKQGYTKLLWNKGYKRV